MMNRMVTMTAFAAALALASLVTTNFADAADKRYCIDCVPGGGGGGAGPGTQTDQGQGVPQKKFEPQDNQNGQGQDQFKHRRSKTFEPNDQFQQGDNNNKYFDKHKSKEAWKYDSRRHERRRHKDNRFRFYFGGFWYPEPYWDEPYYYDDYIVSRVSCREGADIVSERFDRVRILDCGGRIYTYLGRRHGDTFEIRLNSRTGRIIDVRAM